MMKFHSRVTTQVLSSTLGAALLAACSADVGQEDTASVEMAATTGPVSIYPRATAVSEAGDPAFVRVALTRRPRGPLTIDVAASKPGEVAVVPSRLSFKPNDWRTPRLVTITAVDDADFDGDRSVRLTFNVTGPGSAGASCAPSVDVLSVDDDYIVTGYAARDILVGSAPATSLKGINNRGQVIGTFNDTEGASQPFVWERGNATEIGSLGASDAPKIPLDINDAGAVLTLSNSGARFIFDEGRLEPTDGQVVAINDRGHTIGDALYADGARTDIPTMGNGPSEAFALNEKDHATGFGRPLPFGWHPFLWAGQEFEDLGTFGGPAGQGFDINERDEVVGWMYNDSTWERPFYYNKGQVMDLGGVTESRFGVATSINNRGDIVGYDGLRGAPDTAWIGRPGELTAMSSLLVDGRCFQIINPIEINDSGYIAAHAWDCGMSASHAVLFEPIKVAR